MKSKFRCVLRVLAVLALMLAGAGAARAQQPSPSPQNGPDAKTLSAPEAGEDAGDYTIISSIELGYRGLSVDGDHNKYRSDLNYKAGPRLFDSSFLMKSKTGKGGAFDTLLVTTTGWRADPYSHLRISAEKSAWYRFEGTYRRFNYFNFLNNIANPNYATRPVDPVTGQHGFDTRQALGDFDLTILPKNRRVRFNVGYSPQRYSGPAYTTWHYGGDDFMLLSQLRSRSNDFRVGADWRLGPVDFSFLQGFRRFKDDSEVDATGVNLGANPALNNAFLTSIERRQPVRGSTNFSRLSAHTFLAGKVDVTARLVYSKSETDVNYTENATGVNFNTRITNLPGAIGPPNLLRFGQWNFVGDTSRPQILGDLGVTYLATKKLRLSDTFRVETFSINGSEFYAGVFALTSTGGSANGQSVTLRPAGRSVEITRFRKLQNTVEGDYQFNERYAFHFGYRYGTRRVERYAEGDNFGSNGAPPWTAAQLEERIGEEENQTHAFFGGFKARPVKNWTLFFDAERGTADNVFTRVGNYDYTNLRARSRYAPTRNLKFDLSFISRSNSNPTEVEGVSLADFGVDLKSRVFTSNVDWSPARRLSFGGGYSYRWQTSDAVVDYYFRNVRHPEGHSLYFVRNHFVYFDATAELHPRVSLFTAYRINKDTGQGDLLADPTGTPGSLITSYPMSYQSPEVRLAIRLNRRLDWNLGYQYYNYRESLIANPYPQNYHAHQPYTSLRIYFGRGRG
jgi:hypothetical protein